MKKYNEPEIIVIAAETKDLICASLDFWKKGDGIEVDW